MKALILDTATKKSYLILAEDETLTAAVRLTGGHELSKEIAHNLEKLLQGHVLETFSFIGCAEGPGSYTGVRIGIMIAKTLAYVHKIPLLPFSSLLPYQKPNSYAALDAKSMGIYIQKKNEDPILMPTLDAASTLKGKKILSPDFKELQKKLPLSDVIDHEPDLLFLTSALFQKWKKDPKNKELSALYLSPLQNNR